MGWARPYPSDHVGRHSPPPFGAERRGEGAGGALRRHCPARSCCLHHSIPPPKPLRSRASRPGFARLRSPRSVKNARGEAPSGAEANAPPGPAGHPGTGLRCRSPPARVEFVGWPGSSIRVVAPDQCLIPADPEKRPPREPARLTALHRGFCRHPGRASGASGSGGRGVKPPAASRADRRGRPVLPTVRAGRTRRLPASPPPARA